MNNFCAYGLNNRTPHWPPLHTFGCPNTGHNTGAVRSQEPQLLQEIIFTSRLMSLILRIETMLLVQLFNNFTERHSLIKAITSTYAVTATKNTLGVTALLRRWQP